MGARIGSMREEPTGADLARPSAFSPPLSRDPQATRRRVLAVAAAFVMHAAAIALVLVRLPAATSQITSASIAVELVTPAAVEPAARASAAPRSLQPTDSVRESGGRSDRTPGDAEPASPPTADASKAPPSVVQQEKAYDPLLQAPRSSLPAKNTVPRSSLRQHAADSPNPLLHRSPAGPRAKYASNSSGGDRYLNALRDRILRHRVHPAVAAPALVSDTARYEIVMSRRGRLLHVRILQSSGDARLDDAGLKTIERTAPFGRVPADIAGDPVALVLILRMPP